MDRKGFVFPNKSGGIMRRSLEHLGLTFIDQKSILKGKTRGTASNRRTYFSSKIVLAHLDDLFPSEIYSNFLL